MSILWLDMETRSRCDLKTKGLYNYALDPSTQILCMAYAFDDGEVLLWRNGDPIPDAIFNHEGQVRAHNAAFEWMIIDHVMGIGFDPKSWYCTAHQARANCAPGDLADAARFAGASMQKDHAGKALIRKLCIPQLDGSFNNDPRLMHKLEEYCRQDVRTMRNVSKILRELTDEEQNDWLVNERINDRGILVDVELCRAATRYAAEEAREITALVADITKGVVTTVRSPAMRDWVFDRVGPEAKKLMLITKDGAEKRSIDKTVRANLMAMAAAYPDEVPVDVGDVIQCADDVWASSVAKFKRLEALADEEDNRVRGAFVFAGGAATGRAASYGAQVHNFGRNTLKESQRARDAMVGGEELTPHYGKRISDVLKGMLRPSLHAKPGHVLVVADWAAVEARVNAWLSNEPSAQSVLDAFAAGKDIYVTLAAQMFACREEDVTPHQRQIGKVASLACGFGGGHNAFAAMGRAYGITMPETEAKHTVALWRRANPWAVNYWQNLEEAYMCSLRAKDNPFETSAGRVKYLAQGGKLWYSLPSGRVLCYPSARLDEDGVTYAKSAFKPDSTAREWPRARLWKGLACENITQAVANDLLRAALRQLDDVIMHVHDEIVLEVPIERAEQAAQHLKMVMCTPPAWAQGLPLAAEVKIMPRYGK